MSTDHASQPPPVYLASRSPRRALLLREQGFEARVVESGIDDALLAKGNVTAA
jgi:predicted house-cleaning NTP pyrophosphatase (Maf/HAM1 superfamily)